jgi:two-component system LytT family response regulator
VLERVLVADDEPLARERVRALVHALAPSTECRETGNGDDTVDAIRAWKPQALFLDVQMPGLDGFAVAAAIGPAQMPPTAFVTAFDEHAIRAFDIAAVDYLLKPFADERFAESWERLVRAAAAGSLAADAQRLSRLLGDVEAARATGAHLERFLVRIGERTYPVAVNDVRWMRSDGNYIDLHTAKGSHTIRETLANVEARLDPARFIRVHRRVIVAIDFIKEMYPRFAGDQVLVLRDGTKLRVSRTRREALAARLAGPAAGPPAGRPPTR